MYESRSLTDLHAAAQSRAVSFIAEAEMSLDLKIVVACTYRDEERQAELYGMGRRGITGEKIVTNAKPGESFHQYRVAFDIFPLKGGKPILFQEDGDQVSDPVWQKLGEIAEKHGLEWAGRWNKFREGPHFQYTGGLSLTDLRNGNVPT